jgi:asparagine synthase (glutamine-hydrolysing)
MSGIAGIIRFDGGPIEPGLIEKMTAAMHYRGPDGINHWVQGSVALGQCMLRTTPESLEETQPLLNDDGSLVLVMDGRVDNWEELRTELLSRGARLRTRADAELVLRAYEVWGEECLSHIDGDFAFVIWNARARKAFCARDRVGVKPFTYHCDGKILVFASELHPIIDLPWVPKLPNDGMIAEFLADEWHSFDETLWREVMRLPPAHWMVVGSSGQRQTRYWAPDLLAPQPYKKDEDYIDHYRQLFSECVRRLSRSHQPVACEVSGGLDSSAIFCMGEHLRRSGALPAPAITGFTVAFTDEAAANELSYVHAVVHDLGVAVHEVAPVVNDLAWLQELARHYRDFPGYAASGSHANLYLDAKRNGCRVVLTGIGGDQFLQGSGTHFAEELSRRNWVNVLRCLQAHAATFGSRRTLEDFVSKGLLPLLPEPIKAVVRPIARHLKRTRVREAYWLSPLMQERLSQRRSRSHPLSGLRYPYRGQRALMQALYYPFDALGRELMERSLASLGIEARHPFLTANFIQFAFQTPERLRSRGEQQKYIHTAALAGILPRALRERATKADFAGVVAKHLVHDGKVIVASLPHLRSVWLKEQGLRKLCQSYLDSPEQGWQVWSIGNILGCHLALPQEPVDDNAD